MERRYAEEQWEFLTNQSVLVKQLVDALKAVEWVEDYHDNERYEPYCYVCEYRKSHGHAPDCKIGNVLKLAGIQ